MQTSVAETFRDGTVFITGCTGFLGKVVMEKLLRTCPMKKIAILARGKKGFTAHERITDIYKQAVFDRLRREKPDFTNYIKIIEGNLEDSSIVLSSADRDWLIENVNFVFHSAATVKFNDPLELVTKINIQGTENMLAFAAQFKNLKGFVHVSTAYSHCMRNEIQEQFYPVPMTAEELKIALKNDDKSTTARILENWPNTYTFTKAITENLISTNEHHLPISIFRPSIIGCTKSEPEPGWLENMNGPTGIMTSIIVGFLRIIPINLNKVTDVIPVDYSANALISIMWDTVNRHCDPDRLKEPQQETKIYNYVSGVESPLTSGSWIDELYINYYEAPPLKSLWYIFCIFSTNLRVVKVLRFLLHRIPAAFMSLYLILNGKNPKIFKSYKRLESTTDNFKVFFLNEWKFDNSNTRELWSRLSQEDHETFRFSMEKFDWPSYLKDYMHGIKKHVLHERPSDAKEALVKNRRLYFLHYVCGFLLVYVVIQIFLSFISFVF